MKEKLDWVKRHGKGAKRAVYLVVFFIIFGAFIVYVLPNIQIPDDGGETPRDPIKSWVISFWNNTELDSFPNKTGSGTEADPYIIENLTISPGILEWGIIVNDTDKHLIIRNCTFDGTWDSSIGIAIYDSSNVTIENCTVRENFVGIYARNSVDVIIKNNTICNNSVNGILLYLEGPTNIFSNLLINNKDDGIVLRKSSNIEIYENLVKNNDGIGIYQRDSPFNKIINNTVLNNKLEGIYCLYSDFAEIVNNSAVNNKYHGIYSYDSNYIEVSWNNCSQNEGSGIKLKRSCHNRIEGNIAMNNGYSGLHLLFSDNNSVIGNVLLYNTVYDLYIDDSFGIILSGNNYGILNIYPSLAHLIWLILEIAIFFILLIFGVYTLISQIRKRREIKNKIQAEFNIAFSLFLILNAINQLFQILSRVLLSTFLNDAWGTDIIRDYFMFNSIETVIGPYIFSLEFQVLYSFLLFLVSFLFIMYPTEKFLKKTKRTPFSYFLLIAIILLSSTVLIAHFYPKASEVSGVLGVLLSIFHIITILAVISSFTVGLIGFMEFYVTISVKTVGAHRRIAILTIVGFAGWGGAKLLDLFFNEFDDIMPVLILLGPLLFIIATPLLRFRSIMPTIINFYQNQRRCVVHRGVIEGKVFLCSNCNVFYCLRCKEALIDMENKCWNCGATIEKAIIERAEIKPKPVITGPRGDSYLIDESTAELASSEPKKEESKDI
jgi:parallel beta-helix repeat protein